MKRSRFLLAGLGTIVAGCSGKNFAAANESARRGLGVVTKGTPSEPCGG